VFVAEPPIIVLLVVHVLVNAPVATGVALAKVVIPTALTPGTTINSDHAVDVVVLVTAHTASEEGLIAISTDGSIATFNAVDVIHPDDVT
jgi:hypothetical protein